METLGYPTPYSRLVNVNINENEYLMIFQEKTEKEFLERWSVRESQSLKVLINNLKLSKESVLS